MNPKPYRYQHPRRAFTAATAMNHGLLLLTANTHPLREGV